MPRCRQACLYCRGRKTRCDVSDGSLPCTTCKVHGQQCSVMLNKKKNPGKSPGSDFSPASRNLLPRAHLKTRSGSSYKEATDSHSGSLESNSQHFRRAGRYSKYSCYPFLAAQRIPDVGLEMRTLIEQQGCLYLPEPGALDELLQTYFLYAHPTIPILHEGDFWFAYNFSGANSADRPPFRISILLLQTMLFVSCSYVAPSTLQALGFLSATKARAAFYSRAKTLFHLGAFTDDLEASQCALLLTHYITSKNWQLNRYWLSQAIYLACLCHANQFWLLPADSPRREILKRLWWGCILRDRVISLVFRRPLQISLDPSTPHIEDDDFQDSIIGSKCHDMDTKAVLVYFAASFCKFALVLTPLLDLLYVKNERTHLCLQKEAPIYASALDHWYETSMIGFSKLCPNSVGSAVEMPRLTINSSTAKIALYNHAMLVSVSESEESACQADLQLRIEEKLELSIRKITESFMKLGRAAISAFPFVWHLLGKSQFHPQSVSPYFIENTELYRRMMCGFQKLYEYTDKILLVIAIVTGSQDLPGSIISDIPSIGVSIMQPRYYARISLTVDFCLSNGNLPNDSDFPEALQATSNLSSFGNSSQFKSMESHHNIDEDLAQKLKSLNNAIPPELDQFILQIPSNWSKIENLNVGELWNKLISHLG